jgi:hypothetical protein
MPQAATTPVRLTIDGRVVPAPAGGTVLEAARARGILQSDVCAVAIEPAGGHPGTGPAHASAP